LKGRGQVAAAPETLIKSPKSISILVLMTAVAATVDVWSADYSSSTHAAKLLHFDGFSSGKPAVHVWL